MSQPWFTGAASTNQTRRSPSSYVPPHHRTQPNTIPSRSLSRGSHRRNPVSNIDDISQKFHDLDVISQEDNGEKQELPAVGVPVELEGMDIPPPVTSFEEMGFSSKPLNDNIRRCKYVNPTPIQRHAIPVAMSGRDLMACAQTGSGKTAAFCFPIINSITVGKQHQQMPRYGNGDVALPLALILAPTRELASQIHEEARKFSFQTGLKVVVVYGGSPIFQQLRILERGVDILVATPGRLVDLIERSKVCLMNVKYLALDEADRMLDMGFEPQVRKIVQQFGMPSTGARQTLLFSATFPPEIKRLASDFLSNYIFIAAGKVGSSTDLIAQRVEFVPDMDKRRSLINLLYSQNMNRKTAKDCLTLVFVETKKGADALERWLSRKGYPSAAIHGDKVQVERERALNSFRSGHTPILVATDVAARGLDIPHVAHVINFDLPRAVDDYVHRIGRTGRAGKSGVATAFFNEKNIPIAKALVELMHEANQEVPKWLLDYANEPCSNFGGGSSGGGRGGRKYGSDYSNRYDSAADHDPYAVNNYAYEYDAYGNGNGNGNGAMANTYVGDSSDPLSCNYEFDYASVTATGWE
ncbi:hypothetical protein ACS0TY_006060 [Phlomoides rotata]